MPAPLEEKEGKASQMQAQARPASQARALACRSSTWCPGSRSSPSRRPAPTRPQRCRPIRLPTHRLKTPPPPLPRQLPQRRTQASAPARMQGLPRLPALLRLRGRARTAAGPAGARTGCDEAVPRRKGEEGGGGRRTATREGTSTLSVASRFRQEGALPWAPEGRARLLLDAGHLAGGVLLVPLALLGVPVHLLDLCGGRTTEELGRVKEAASIRKGSGERRESGERAGGVAPPAILGRGREGAHSSRGAPCAWRPARDWSGPPSCPPSMICTGRTST